MVLNSYKYPLKYLIIKVLLSRLIENAQHNIDT